MRTKQKEKPDQTVELLETESSLIVVLKKYCQIIFGTFTDQELFNIAQILKPKIDGFGPKTLSKAPKQILRKKTIEKLNVMTDFEKFIRTFYSPYLSKYKDVKDTTEMIWKMTLDQVPNAGKFVVLAEHEPEFFLAHQSMISENINKNIDPFEGIVKKPAFSKAAEMVFSPHFDEELLNKMKIAFHDLYENEKDLFEEFQSGKRVLLDFLIGNLNIINETGKYLLLASTTVNQWQMWDVESKLALLGLVHYDAIKLIMEQSNEVNNLRILLTKNEKTIQKISEQRDKDKSGWDKQEEEFQKEIKDLQNISNQLKIFEDINKELKLEIEQKSQQVIHFEKNKNISMVNETLINDDNIRIVTFQKSRGFEKYVPLEHIHYIQNDEDFNKLLLSYGELKNNILWFVDLEGCPTKDSFKFEDTLRKHQAVYRIVSGDTTKLIRKIIYYIEGEMEYETHTRNR
ncbi:hypothetical protein [Paenibacillus sp. V4I5]|uniref:hypothetical protein n=1 Tax=Paenibacillus sp. V4I5 TaxID=3042306 RepID=UPI0027915891|nr:hypothetical protein [Paenibacillus sp. V4I5]MDQ0917561.1 hypothetical protein [Paenibacillus sp. V4I5]